MKTTKKMEATKTMETTKVMRTIYLLFIYYQPVLTGRQSACAGLGQFKTISK